MGRETGVNSPAVAALAQRYRRMITGGTLLFVVLCGLTVWGGWVREYDSQVTLAAQRVKLAAIRLKGIISAANDHVAQMARWAEDFPYHAPYPGPIDLRLAAQQALAASPNGDVNLDVLSTRASEQRLGLLIALTEAAQPRPNGGPSNLDLALPLLDRFRYAQATIPFLRWSYFFSARKDLLAMAPWAASSDVLGAEPNGRSFLQHSWTYEITEQGLPENNPDRHGYWTKAYWDQAGAGLMVSHGIPVYWGDEFIGVMGADVLLAFLADFLAEFPDPDGLLVIADQHGELLGDRRGAVSEGNEIPMIDAILPPALKPWSAGTIGGAENGRLVDGWHVISESIGEPQWTIVYLLPRSALAARVAKQFAPQLGLTVLLMVALAMMNRFLRQSYVAPALGIAAFVASENESANPPQPTVPEIWRPWVDAMVRAFRERREYLAELRTEIGDRKRAEESLRETTRRLETLIGHLPGTAFRMHYLPGGLKRLSFVDGGTIRKHPRIAEWLMSLTPEQFLQTHDEDGRRQLYHEVPRALLEHGSAEATFKQLRAGRPARWLRTWETLVDKDGESMVSEGLVLDVTEEIEAKGSLERVNRILMMLSQANEELIRAADEQGLFSAMCRVIVETGGYRMAWVGIGEDGHTISPVAHAGHEAGFLATGFDWNGQAIPTGELRVDADLTDGPELLPWRQSALERGYRSCIALPLTLGQGRHGLLSVYAAEPRAFGPKETALFVDLANDLAYGVSVMRERERRLEMERILAHSQKMEALGQMAGGVAHDFNNLLGAILGFANFIVEDSPEKTPVHYYARRILAAGRRGKAVVSQILSFAHKGDILRERLDLGQLLTEAHTLASASVPSTTCLTMTNDLPGAVVVGDADGLSRMLLNLCLNAHDAFAGNPGTLSLHIRPTAGVPRLSAPEQRTIDVWQDEDGAAHAVSGIFDPAVPHVSLVVSDNGCGMDAPLLEKVFSPFFTTKGRGAGTGLGLAAVHSAILAHSGALVVESRIGIGTSFEVILPLAEAGLPTVPLAPPPAVSSPPAVPHRVLLVDDDPDFGEMVLAGLERRGAEVAPCADPLTALAGVRDNPQIWDVVITDQTMPNMTGLELIREIKKIRPELPCILCTGFTEAQLDASLLQEVGVFAKLYKPLDMDHLVATLARAINPAKP